MSVTKDYFDITPLVSRRLGVFPGDVAFSRSVSLDPAKGDNILLSSVTTTLHLGAHADAPNHYHHGASAIAERDLALYMGRAQVLQASVGRGERIGLRHLRDPEPKAPRVLFRTGTFPDPESWNSDFASLTPELITHLAVRGVKLIGIDTPSIDPEDSRHLEAHAAIATYDMAILEGLDLTQVPEGLYTLIALPLRLEEADASPVRAILLRDATLLSKL
jgi:arylformamidase